MFATQATRQPGSVLKPFVYATALENGFTPLTIIPDIPLSFYNQDNESIWSPQNL